MNDYQPGDSVVSTHLIVVGPVRIPAGTLGVVEWAYPHMARVQFVGYLAQSNIPCEWLRAVQLVAREAVQA